jgi:hypothetical protein
LRSRRSCSFYAPGRGELLGWVIGVEHHLQARSAPHREGVVAAEQQSAVRPGRVDLTAAALLPLPDEPLPYPGHHEVGQLH